MCDVRYLLITYYLLLTTFFSGCAENGKVATINYTYHTRIAKHKKPVIGALIPLSGRYKAYGEAIKQGMSFFSTPVIYYDTKGDPIEAVLGAKELILKGNVTVLVGPLFSITVIPVACVCDFYKVVMISPTATESRITSISPYAYRINSEEESEAAAIGEYGVSVLGITRFAVLCPDDAHTSNVVDVFISKVEALGAEIIIHKMYSSERRDFEDMMLEIKEKMPEGIFIPAYPEDILAIAPKLWYYEVVNDSVNILGISSWGKEKVISKGEKYIEGVFFAEVEEDSIFKKMFYEKHQTEPEKLSILGYNVMLLLERALSEGIKDRVSLKNWLSAHKKEATCHIKIKICKVENGTKIELSKE